MGILSKLFGNSTKNQPSAAPKPGTTTISASQEEGFSEITTSDDAQAAGPVYTEHDSLLFLPVIRNFTDGDVFEQTIVNEKLGDDIAAFIAQVEVKPNGRTGIDYVLKSSLAASNMAEDEALHRAMRNLKNAKLSIEGLTDPQTGDMMISVTSEIGLATCLLYDHHFIDKLQTDLETEQLHVTIIHSGSVYFTAANSSLEKDIEEMALENTHTDVLNIHSATYLWINHTLQLVKKYKN